jgi:hypothetical protein
MVLELFSLETITIQFNPFPRRYFLVDCIERNLFQKLNLVNDSQNLIEIQSPSALRLVMPKLSAWTDTIFGAVVRFFTF